MCLTYQFICIDDDINFLDFLIKKINQFFNGKLSFEIKTYTSMIPVHELEKADALFLDIEVQQDNSLTFVKEMEQNGKHIPIVFISRYDHYVFDSQNFNMIYFIRKAYFDQEYEIAMNKLYHQLFINHDDFMILSHSHHKIYIHDIIYIETYSHDYMLHTTTQSLPCVKKDIDQLLHKYDFFVRIHRSYIFNKHYVTLIDKNYIYLHDIYKIKLGKQKRKELQNLINTQ